MPVWLHFARLLARFPLTSSFITSTDNTGLLTNRQLPHYGLIGSTGSRYHRYRRRCLRRAFFCDSYGQLWTCRALHSRRARRDGIGDLFVGIVDVLPSVLAPLTACAGERALNGNVSCHSVIVVRRLSIPPTVSVNLFSRMAGC